MKTIIVIIVIIILSFKQIHIFIFVLFNFHVCVYTRDILPLKSDFLPMNQVYQSTDWIGGYTIVMHPHTNILILKVGWSGKIYDKNFVGWFLYILSIAWSSFWIFVHNIKVIVICSRDYLWHIVLSHCNVSHVS